MVTKKEQELREVAYELSNTIDPEVALEICANEQRDEMNKRVRTYTQEIEELQKQIEEYKRYIDMVTVCRRHARTVKTGDNYNVVAVEMGFDEVH